MSDRFKTSADLDTLVQRARAEHDTAIADVRDHLAALNEKEMHGILIKDAVYDALRITAPSKHISGPLSSWNK